MITIQKSQIRPRFEHIHLQNADGIILFSNNGGDFTGGDVGNFLDIWLYYQIIDF